MAGHLHRCQAPPGIRDEGGRVNREVLPVSAAPHHPHRELGAGLPLPPAMTRERALLTTSRPRTAGDPRHRPKPSLVVHHVRRAEEASARSDSGIADVRRGGMGEYDAPRGFAQRRPRKVQARRSPQRSRLWASPPRTNPGSGRTRPQPTRNAPLLPRSPRHRTTSPVTSLGPWTVTGPRTAPTDAPPTVPWKTGERSRFLHTAHRPHLRRVHCRRSGRPKRRQQPHHLCHRKWGENATVRHWARNVTSGTWAGPCPSLA